MVKIHCDRCGKEIKERYYTVNIYGYDTNPKYDYYTEAACASSCSNVRDETLRRLNAIKMYCNDCKDEIEAFIYNKENA